ncbi:MAG: nucleotide kinase domain-containing protein [Pseudonocardiaceae bacterium]
MIRTGADFRVRGPPPRRHAHPPQGELRERHPGELRERQPLRPGEFHERRHTDVIHWMVDHQEDSFNKLGLQFQGLWGRPLHAIDCQGLFCETDKYCREAAPELTSARKRIKARFTVTPEPIELFFPPKWGINERLPKSPVFGEISQPEPNEQVSLF